MNRQAIRVGFSGLTGMIGRNFLDLYCREPELRERLTLVAFTRSADCPEFLRQAGVSCRRIDYANAESFGGTLEDLDVFFHFAGSVRTVRPAEFYAGNRDATASVVDAVSRFGGRLQQLVYSSSLAAVGPSSDPACPRQEDWPPAPVSHYGKSKLLAEHEVRSTAVEWTILRLGVVWGPYDQDGLHILRAARAGILPCVGAGPHLMSYIFAQDLVRLLPGVILNERMYRGTYNVSYDSPLDMTEYCRRAREAMGLKPRVVQLSLPRLAGQAAMAWLAAVRRLSGRASILQPDKVRELMVRHWIHDTRRLKEALGIDEIREQGALRDTIAWFQARGLL
jgi:nucleoside-diphosphate-sugar epimerase